MIQYYIDKKSLIDFHSSYISTTKDYKKNVRISKSFTIIIGILLIILSLLCLPILCLIIPIIMIILICTCKSRTLKTSKLLLNNICRASCYKNLFEDTKISTENKGLHVVTKSLDKLYKWSAIKRLCVLDEYIFIQTYCNNDQLLIPVKAFETTDDKNQFLENIVNKSSITIQYSYPIDIKYLSPL